MATAKGGALMASTSRALQVPSLGYDGMNPRICCDRISHLLLSQLVPKTGIDSGDGHGVAEAYSKDRHGRSNPETPQRQSLQLRCIHPIMLSSLCSSD
jgi:hypothetical protein